MKERKKYADSYLCEGDLARAVMMSYTTGATEQQDIDVKVAARCVCENYYKDCEFTQCTDEECMLQCPILIDLYNKMKGE